MDTDAVVALVKERLGIRSSVRDTYLTAIANGVINELTDEQGITLDGDNPSHLIFCADLAAWRYSNRDSAGGMPRHLQYRLHNLIIHAGGTT